MSEYYMGKDGFYWFVGVVEDRNDPKKLSRVRVRVLGAHTGDTSNTGIPTADLPWAHVMMPVTAGANSGIGVSPHFLLEGTWVLGFFRDVHQQEPVIMGALPGINNQATSADTHPTSTKSSADYAGFKDPGVEIKPAGSQEVVYPTALYSAKADTNVLAQQAVVFTQELEEGQERHPSYTVKGGLVKEDAYHTKWTNASGAEIQQSVSTQGNSLYPFNHVIETESGHYIEIDDTKGNERIHVYHKAGTFIEISPSGDVILKTPDFVNMTTIIGGNSDTYIKGNYSLTVDGNIDIHCTGTENRTSDDEGSDDSSDEDSNGEGSKLGTVTHVIAKGDFIETITEGNRTTTITAGTETVDIKGAVTHTYQDTLTETITKAVTQTYSDTFTLAVTKDVTQTFSAALKTDITAAADIKAGAAMTIGGSTISFN